MSGPFYAPDLNRTNGRAILGKKPTDLLGFYNGVGVAQPAATSSTRAALEALGLIAAGGIGGGAATAITGNTDGLTTAIIPDGATFVVVTSSASTKIVTLPTPTPGRELRIDVAANGFKLRSNAPATVAINGGTGSAVVSAIPANSTLRLICVSATSWKGDYLDADSDVAKIPAAA